ncbi:MAG TPA: pyridoxal phosphate-dependent aminotransferase [Firmicutes bacterium]|nr:pyridoxal phosphate-dependent aminotransferase [Bacillota bacterium]
MFSAQSKKGLVFNDIIFINNAQARERAAQPGGEKVINATIGALLDERGKLVTFPSVDEIHRNLDIAAQSSYAPMGGYPSFLKAAEHFCFEEFRPERHIEGVVMSGGLAGIHHALVNYTEPGDFILTTDWHWGPYDGIAKEAGRKVKTFPLLSQGGPDWEVLEQTMKELACEQSTLFLLINTPAHNPTGYSMTHKEMEYLIDLCNEIAHPVILFLDVAYIEYAPREKKRLFSLLSRLKTNTLALVDYSISKGFAKYGLRTAALFAIHQSREPLDEFRHMMLLSNRGIHGSVSSTGQLLLAALYEDKSMIRKYREEIGNWRRVLKERGCAFFHELKPSLAMPHDDGFFAAVQCDDAAGHCETLKEENIFLIPLNKGLRVALCSMTAEQARTTARALNRLSEKFHFAL